MKFMVRVKSFLKEVFLEIRKINWLTRRDLLRYTIIVIGVAVAVAIFLGGLDFIFTTIVKKFIL